MVHGDVPEPSPVDSAPRSNFLAFETRNGLEPALVEEFRGKCANVGMKSPGVLQKQPLLGADGELAVENVVQGGDAGAFGMAPLCRLVQLPRIAQQHQIPGSVRNREDVGQRHLGGLVDEEYVHGVLSLWTCPKPGRAAGDSIAGRQRLEYPLVVARKGQMRLIVLRVVGLLDASNVDIRLLRG